MRTRAFLLLAVVTIAAHGAPRVLVAGAQQVSPAPAASPEIDAFVRQAFEELLDSGDIPDFALVSRLARIPVRQDVSPELSLGPDALPKRPPREFFLITEAALQSEANRTGETYRFLFISSPTIDGETASLHIGSGILLPRESRQIRLCCCSATAEFRRAVERWTFVRWTMRICS